MIHHLVWKLYHLESLIQSRTENIEERNEALKGLRAEQNEYDKKLKAARKEQTAAQKEVTKQEKLVKKRERDLEDKVSWLRE